MGIPIWILAFRAPLPESDAALRHRKRIEQQRAVIERLHIGNSLSAMGLGSPSNTAGNSIVEGDPVTLILIMSSRVRFVHGQHVR